MPGSKGSGGTPDGMISPGVPPWESVSHATATGRKARQFSVVQPLLARGRFQAASSSEASVAATFASSRRSASSAPA